MLTGLPDWQRRLVFSEAMVFAAFDAAAEIAVLPDRLELARDGRGNPFLALRIMRREDDPGFRAAWLDIGIAASWRANEAVLQLSREEPGLRARPILPAGGFLTLRVETGAAASIGPVPLDWNDLAQAVMNLTLTPEDARVLEQVIEDATPIRAIAEIEIEGVSERLPLVVTVDPAALAAALRQAADAEGTMSRDELERWLAQRIAGVAITVEGDVAAQPAAVLGAVLADRVRTELARPVPAGGSVVGRLLLPAPDEVPSGRVRWDLSRPAVGPRPFLLAFDPVAAARALAGGDVPLVKRVTIPGLSLGRVRLTLAANLPLNPTGARSFGAELRVPPSPPFRPQGIVRVVELDPTGRELELEVALAPGEPLNGEIRGFALFLVDGNVLRREGPSRPITNDSIILSPADFPVRFIHVRAGPQLLELARVVCRARVAAGPGTVATSVTLAGAVAQAAFALPDEGEPIVEAMAEPLDGGSPVTLAAASRSRLDFDLFSVPGFGGHAVAVSCLFAEGTTRALVDLTPEMPDPPQGHDTLLLTPSAPTATWRYLASSPFRPGYRWRWHDAGAGDTAWSASLPADQPLQIDTHDFGRMA